MTGHQRFEALLAALCTTFLIATVWLYVTNDQTNRQLSLASKSVVARVYSSQLSLIRLNNALEQCQGNVSCATADISNRLQGLATSLAELADSLGPTRRANLYSTIVGKLISKYSTASGYAPVATSAVDQAEIGQLSAEVAPLGTLLQSIMSDGLQDVANARSEEVSPGLADISIAFTILVLSWAGLTALLFIELRQRGNLLRQIRTMHDAETEMQRSTVRLLQSLPVPVLLTNAEGLVYANHAARTLAAVPGRLDTLSNLAHALSAQFESKDADGPNTRDFTYSHGDGTLRQLSASISDIPLTGARHQVYVILDNTLLRDAELRAMTSGKLAVLGEISSAVAHELNQPLAVIKAAAANGKMLAGNIENSKPVIEKFDRINSQIERARRIIGNVRKLGHPRAAAGVPFHVARSLNSTFGLVSEQFRLAGVVLEIDVNLEDYLTVVGDYTLFEIAILNILLNARDAFESRPRSGRPATVRVRAAHSNGMIRIEIEDDAGGIPDELLPHIFESFVSSKSADKGTGLGLSIARRAVEGMHGKLAAENVAGGALFTILLPAVVKEAVA